MKRQKDLTKYFSGSALMRLPLYKVLTGGMAVLLCASLGIGVAAAAFSAAPTAQPAASEQPPIVQVATVETAATPEPTATPAPRVELSAEVTVVQQDIGVQLYTLTYPEEPVFENPEDADFYLAIPNQKTPFTGVELNITITDAKGKATDYAVDPASGTALAEGVEPGDYTVTVPAQEGYTAPAPQTVTVKEKVVYKADVKAVKDKIVQVSQVVESQEDSSYGNTTVVPEEIKDTVTYADPQKNQVSSTKVYTAKTSSRGYLVLANGTETPYKPQHDANGVLTGAQRDSAYSTVSARVGGSGITLLGTGRSGSIQLLAAETSSIAPTDPAGTATPAPTDTPAPSDTPAPTTTASPAPTDTPAPTATATPAPTATPVPTATPDPYAGFPQTIEAAKLADYGFSITVSDKVVYEYTGWQTIDNKTYYYDPTTHQPVTGTQVIQGNIYTFATDGALNQTARGVDVSKFQGNINWNAVAADGITFAIIRCGYRGYGSGALVEDSTFRANIKGATAAGLKVGVYFYSQAVNEAEAVEEASMVLSLCSGYSLPAGVYFDTEKVAGDTGRADGISSADRTACAVAFCETIRNGGYNAGVYSYSSWFYNQMNFANISKYRIWIAQYRDTLSFQYHYNIWQYSSTGSVKGISQPVDMNLG